MKMRKRNEKGVAVLSIFLALVSVPVSIRVVQLLSDSNKEVANQYGSFPPQVHIKDDQDAIARRKDWFVEHGFDPDRWNENFHVLHREKEATRHEK